MAVPVSSGINVGHGNKARDSSQTGATGLFDSGQPVPEFRRHKVLDFSNNADMFASAMLEMDGASLMLDVPARSVNTVAIR
jgi:hypothetical protein